MFNYTHPIRRAFTLIELLIVVAIIAILAAIAVPNFLEAQTRSKISRMKNDMRTVATGLESYKVDHNWYPYDGYALSGSHAPLFNYWYLPTHLSTPVAYLSTCVFVDPFRDHITPANPEVDWQWNNIRYTSIDSTWGLQFSRRTGRAAGTLSTYYGDLSKEFGGWRLNSAGPDKTYGPNGWQGVSDYPAEQFPLPYDASNGTISDGDIIRTQKSPTGYVNAS
jgi:prepilin-type N-terminal cleavage/methylation domain-containing protein